MSEQEPVQSAGASEAAEVALPKVTPASQPVQPADPPETRFLKWALLGPQGLRSGWSIALFVVLAFLFMALLDLILALLLDNVLHYKSHGFTPFTAISQEVVLLIGILCAAWIAARIEHRRLLDYNLTGPRRLTHLVAGCAGGFIAISVLVGVLYAGGWLQFGGVALSGLGILEYAALWGVAFALTGLAEEGSVRCYLQYTLTRGINYWWALGTALFLCLNCLLFNHNQSAWGIYLLTALGVVPCLVLHLRKAPSAGFWQAAWVTSTFFGFMHTGNNGETWIGIFSTAIIGFTFCVSIRVTGSAWWAIGFHAAWDWAQTFFYGTPDSGIIAQGHYFTSTPHGAVLWSGGSDGPEGSVLVIPLVLLTMAALIAIYGRRGPRLESPSPAVLTQLS